MHSNLQGRAMFTVSSLGSRDVWAGVNVVTSPQLRMARAALDWTLDALAERSGVHRTTIARLESGAPWQPGVSEAVARALECAGIEFIPDNGSGPAVRLKRS